MRTADRRSLALHARVAECIRADPGRLEPSRRRVQEWLRTGNVHPHYAHAWRDLLEGPLDSLLSTLVDPGERATALRKSSPFAGILDARERWEILKTLPMDRAER